MTQSEMLGIIHLREYFAEMRSIDEDDPERFEKRDIIQNRLADEAEKAINEENASIGVAILDALYNCCPNVAVRLLQRNNEKVIREMLTLEKIIGFDASFLKNNLEDSNELLLCAVDSSKIEITNIYGCKVHKILSSYLKDKKNVDKMQEQGLMEFYQNFGDVNEIVFTELVSNSFPNRNKYIDSLFTIGGEKKDKASVKLISDVFNNVLLNTPEIDNYNYEEIIYNYSDLLCHVRGLIRKASPEIIAKLIPEEDQLDEAIMRELNHDFKKIVRCNRGDEECLRWFFKEIADRLPHDSKFRDYIKGEDYYKKYCDIDVEKKCEESLNTLLEGKSDIDPIILQDLGMYEGFKARFNDLLKLYITSDDIAYKKKLIMPLVVALMEKQKEKYNLDFKYVFSSRDIKSKIGGTYLHDQKTIYINPKKFELADDMDAALLASTKTVFHEIRHARQYKEVEESRAFSFSNLVMAIDLLNINMAYDNYYQTNYEHISFERDARETAYVENMTLYRNYPEMQKRIKQEDGDYKMADHIRKKEFTTTEAYFGVVDIFMRTINRALKKDNARFKASIFQDVDKYPVIREFFDIDTEKKEMRPKDLSKKLKEAEQMPDSPQKQEMLYSIRAFSYSLRVGEFINQKQFGNVPKGNGYNEQVIKEVEDKVGDEPSR